MVGDSALLDSPIENHQTERPARGLASAVRDLHAQPGQIARTVPVSVGLHREPQRRARGIDQEMGAMVAVVVLVEGGRENREHALEARLIGEDDGGHSLVETEHTRSEQSLLADEVDHQKPTAGARADARLDGLALSS